MYIVIITITMKYTIIFFTVISALLMSCGEAPTENETMEEVFKPYSPPISYEKAREKADSILKQMTLEEKISMVGGYNSFFIKGFEKFGIPSLYLSDATQGVHIREDLDNQLEKSTAFPCPIALTSTWNTKLAHNYAKSIGEECRAGDIAVLLGPGMNIYRISENGRNFEYFGEDPFLASRLIENYVVGMQNTGTISTLKHFIANNSDYRRRTSNSVVDERALREIYMPAFEAGVNAGAMAVMTSYNQVNGEWAGQSNYVISKLLREDLGFKWLVMSDWWSVWDSEKAIKSGLDLDMPGEPQDWMSAAVSKDEFYIRNSAKSHLEEGKVKETDIDRMARNIITTEIAMGLLDRSVKDTSYLANFNKHIEVALQTAREGIVLLRNENSILPINPNSVKNILLTGEFVEKIPMGGGSAEVAGFNPVSLKAALDAEYGGNIRHIDNPNETDITDADIVIVSVGTLDTEGSNRPFDLSEEVNNEISRIAGLNANSVVVVNSGGGINMSPWNDNVAAIIYGWYPGQTGFNALAEIISGKTNPSGKLPITIEKSFKDSPAFPYIPEGEELYSGWDKDMDMEHPIHDIVYNEGVFVGYRWYESKDIEPLYAFGHGLSYTTFAYESMKFSDNSIAPNEKLTIDVAVKNTGKQEGMEIIQLYVSDKESSVERPIKELKGFRKVSLAPGEKKTVKLQLSFRDFAFWDTESESWKVEPGNFEILVGSASNNIQLKETVTII